MVSTVMQYVVLAYCTVALCKFILVMPSIPVVVAALSWATTGVKGVIVPRYVISIPCYMALISFVWWVPTLFAERSNFFLAYRRTDSVRAALQAHRAMSKLQE